LTDLLSELIKIKEGEIIIIQSFNAKKDENSRKLQCTMHYVVTIPDVLIGKNIDSEFDSDEFLCEAIIQITSKDRAMLTIKPGYSDNNKEILKQELLVIEDKNDLHVMKIE
jgi:hypothetical protein